MKKINRKPTLLIACLLGLGITGVVAQNAFTGSGGTATGTGGTVNYSVGQVFYQTFNGAGYTVSHGVQQRQGADFVPATALNFDGVNDYVSVNNTIGNFGTGDFTIEMKIKTSQVSTAYFLSKRNVCNHDNFISLAMSGGKLVVELDENGAGLNYLALIGTVTINDNGWHHIAVTRKSGNVTMYADGVADGTGTSTAKINNASTLTLGESICNGLNGSVKYAGDMDEIRIWNRALCKGEIQHNMNCELNPASQLNLIALYHLNHGFVNADNQTVTSATDASGNGNTGTLNNFALTGVSSNWTSGIVTGTCSIFISPTATITGSTVLCTGGSVLLSANTGPGYTYQWVKNGNNIPGATGATFTVTTPGSYKVVVTINGCSATSAVKVITLNPEINISICAGITRTIYKGTTGGVGPFGPQGINLTSTITGGTPGYTYSWSPATGLNNATIANPVASPMVATTYTLTVTDSKGCTRSLGITINVLPLSSAVCSGNGKNVKFNVCHVPPGNPSNAHNICINGNALPAHLTSGSNGHNNCYLGPCGQQLCFSTNSGQALLYTRAINTFAEDASEAGIDVEEKDRVSVQVYPNPSHGNFIIQVFSTSDEPVTVRIFDINGTLKSVSTPEPGTNYIIVGTNNWASGMYFAEVRKGTNRKVVKLVKLN